MTPRDRVRAALRFETADRAPFSWGFGPTGEMARDLAAFLQNQGLSWPRLRAAVDDVRAVDFPYAGPPLPERTDIWGVRRRPVAYGTGTYQEIEHMPLAGMETSAAVEAYPWPDPNHYDYARLQAAVEASSAEGRCSEKLLGPRNRAVTMSCWARRAPW